VICTSSGGNAFALAKVQDAVKHSCGHRLRLRLGASLALVDWDGPEFCLAVLLPFGTPPYSSPHVWHSLAFQTTRLGPL
jgi:hypothetical protein